MPLIDYRDPKIRRGFRIAAAVVLVVGLAMLYGGHLLTLEVVRVAQPHPDAAHPYAVLDRFYVPAPLGLARNLTLLIGAMLTVASAVVLLHRELRWWFWDRHLQK
ncbi:MAG TPA: hypothetical protein VGC36_07025 [Rhizomicrobium sp.]